MILPRRPARAAALLATLTLALAACKDEPKPAQKTGGAATGEILPGSASDAMIQYDTLRSQPPLAPPVVSSSAPARERRPSRGDASEAASGAQPSASNAPAAAPSIAAEPME